MKKTFIFRFIAAWILLSFVSSSIMPPAAYAQAVNLPAPGAMVGLTPAYVPVLMKGVRVHPENPLLFDFIVDSGKSNLKIESPAFKAESQKLIKYFLASLTIKEDDLWVNLSPYEKDRMIPQELGKTEMGRDLLAQDYILKQLTASLIYPEKDLGKSFWNRIYTKAKEKFGTTDIPVDTFNKVWITADKAKVFERNNVAYVVGAHLKVMLESDYMAAQYAQSAKARKDAARLELNTTPAQELAKQVIRDVVIPEIEKEVNEGMNFALLRQMHSSMILASWYKLALKDALLNQVYSNKAKTSGVLSDDPAVKEKIYAQYLEAYKKGVFNYIKDDMDAVSQQPMPRKYFSGGVTQLTGSLEVGKSDPLPAEITPIGLNVVIPTQIKRTVSSENAMLTNTDKAANNIKVVMAPADPLILTVKESVAGAVGLGVPIAVFASTAHRGSVQQIVALVMLVGLYLSPFLFVGKNFSFGSFLSSAEPKVKELSPTDVVNLAKGFQRDYQTINSRGSFKFRSSDFDNELAKVQNLLNKIYNDAGKKNMTFNTTEEGISTLNGDGMMSMVLSNYIILKEADKLDSNKVKMIEAAIKGLSNGSDILYQDFLGKNWVKLVKEADGERLWRVTIETLYPETPKSLSQNDNPNATALLERMVFNWLERQGFSGSWVLHANEFKAIDQVKALSAAIVNDAGKAIDKKSAGKDLKALNDVEKAVYDLNESDLPFIAYINLKEKKKLTDEQLAAIDAVVATLSKESKERIEQQEWAALVKSFDGQKFKRTLLNVIYPSLCPTSLPGLTQLVLAHLSLSDGVPVDRPRKEANFSRVETHAYPVRVNKDNAMGGIDLNAMNMDLDVARDGKGVTMTFDPAMVAAFQKGNFTGVEGVILRIVPIANPLSLLGMDAGPGK
ncbi:MAG: hypothetical protein WCI27_05095 [Candidatus Omnitrophota bacterium]